MDASAVWYFAYGSNMQTATFRGRRGIAWRRALPGRLPGWRLVLDKPPILPIGEAFANVVPNPSAAVLGVLYEITPADLEHVELTEGVRVGNYRRVEVTAEALAGTLVVPACTLASERRDPGLRPSDRYMACLAAGAAEHGLPAAYVAWLRAVPTRAETPEAKAMRAALDAAIRRPAAAAGRGRRGLEPDE